MATKEITITILVTDEEIYDLIEGEEIKPSQAKVNKLKRIFREDENDFHDELHEALTELLTNKINEEWGD